MEVDKFKSKWNFILFVHITKTGSIFPNAFFEVRNYTPNTFCYVYVVICLLAVWFEGGKLNPGLLWLFIVLFFPLK